MALVVQQQQSREHPFLFGLARVIHFLLSLIGLVSLVLLIIGFVISMSNVMTNGAIVDSGSMRNIWAIATSLAIEANIPLMFFHAWQSWKHGRRAEGWCSFLLGFALACVTGMSVGIESLQQSLNISLADAITRMHIDMSILVYLRVCLIILLVIREGYRLFVLLDSNPPVERVEQHRQFHIHFRFLAHLWQGMRKWNTPSVTHPLAQETPVPEREELPLPRAGENEQMEVEVEVLPVEAPATSSVEVEMVEVETDPEVQAVEVVDFRSTSRHMTVKEAASHIGCSERQVRNLRGSGILATDGDGLSTKSVKAYARKRQKQSA